MARRLVFVHGRAHEGSDGLSLAEGWLESLRRGWTKSGLPPPVTASDVRLPYYGHVMANHVPRDPRDLLAQIIVQGRAASPSEREFMLLLLRQVASAHGISEGEIRAATHATITEKADPDWEGVRRILHV